MKYYKNSRAAAFLIGVFYMVSVGGLFAQDGAEKQGEEAPDLKKLLVEKFDTNLDKNLSPAEKIAAVAFLGDMDDNGDGQLSRVERDSAIARLQEMESVTSVRGTEKQTLGNRNLRQRATKWRKFMKSLPHGAGDRIFTGKIMPGDKGFDPKGEKFVDITMVDSGPEVTKRAITAAELNSIFSDRKKLNANARKKFSATHREASKKESKSLNEADGFYSNSMIMTADGIHTAVPRRAVLNIPEKLQSMIVKEPVGRFMRWSVFLKKYPRAVEAKSVSWATVRGDVPFSKKEVKSLQESNKIVVAVFKGNPVTVSKPRAKEGESEDSVEGLASDGKNERNK